MAATATDTLIDRRVPQFATSVVVPIAVVVTVLHCAASTLGDDHWFDEVYMLAIGRNHLDWGSADQPPLAPALAALMDWLAPGSQSVRSNCSAVGRRATYGGGGSRGPRTSSASRSRPARRFLSVSVVGSGVVEQMAPRTADAYRSLAPDQRDRTVLMGESYIIAAYIDR